MNLYAVNDATVGELEQRMQALGIRETDLEESFIRSGGKGGQNVNKVATCVRLVHRPTGLSVKCQRERSQALNRFFARRMLCDAVERKITGAVAAEKSRVEKIRRQKRRRSRRAKQKMLANKHHQSAKKDLRRSVNSDNY